MSTTATILGGYGLANPAGPLPFRPADIPASVAQRTWPPEQEMQMFIPTVGSRNVLAQDGKTIIDCAVRLSPSATHARPFRAVPGGPGRQL